MSTAPQLQPLPNVLEYTGDLFDAEVEAIMHQCNCDSKGISGIAAAIFKKHPEANTYGDNPNHKRFGTFQAFAVPYSPYNFVVNLYAQIYPGKYAEEGATDAAGPRLIAFRAALGQYLFAMHPHSVALPKFIGCGLAGGNWDAYYKVIINMAEQYPDIDFHIIEKK